MNAPTFFPFPAFPSIQPPMLLGLTRTLDHLVLAQKECEKQILGTCFIGEGTAKGFTARFLEGLDLTLFFNQDIAQVLASWKHCPLTDETRRTAWLFALVFAKNLHLITMKYCADFLPESEGPQLLARFKKLSTGLQALQALEGWADDPAALLEAGETPILTANREIAAGVTTRGNVGLHITNHNRAYLLGELLAARPERIVVTDDLPDASNLVDACNAAGLKAFLYSEQTA